MERIINRFIEVLGDPISVEALEDYVNTCIELHNQYQTEFHGHHILPKALFPEHIKDSWNIVNLTPYNHCRVHHKLILAYSRYEFIRPLNQMKPISEEEEKALKEARSEAAKQYWIELRKDPEAYDARRKNRSDWMKENYVPGTKFYDDMIEALQIRYADNIVKDKISATMQEWWDSRTEEEMYQISEKRKNQWTDEMRDKLIAHLDARYADEEFMIAFRAKMTIVNADPEKRESASKSMKLRWEDEEYRTKTLAAREEANKQLKESGKKRSNSDKMKAKWEDAVWKAKILADRAERRAKKKTETSTENKSKRKSCGNNSSTMTERWKDPVFRKMMLDARKKDKHETN